MLTPLLPPDSIPSASSRPHCSTPATQLAMHHVAVDGHGSSSHVSSDAEATSPGMHPRVSSSNGDGPDSCISATASTLIEEMLFDRSLMVSHQTRITSFLVLQCLVPSMSRTELVVWYRRLLVPNVLSVIMVVLFLFGLVGILLAMFSIWPPWCVWFMLLGYPSMLARLAFVNLHLAKLLLSEFEFWFLLLQLVGMVIGVSDMLYWDQRVFGAFSPLVAYFNVLVSDAIVLPRSRQMVALLTGNICQAVLVVGIIANWGQQSLRRREVALYDGYTFVVADFVVNRVITMMLFFNKHLFNLIRHPDSPVLIRSRFHTCFCPPAAVLGVGSAE